MNKKKSNIVALNILSLIAIFFIIIGIYSLSKNITMKETIGEITNCERIYDYHRNNRYWVASAEFNVGDKKYSGRISVSSHKFVGQKIKILYNPKNPNEFDSKSSSYAGVTSIIIGCVFLIPKIQYKRKMKEEL